LNSAVGGRVITMTYQPPHLIRIGSLHTHTLTHEEGSSTDFDSFREACGNLIGDVS
jgi:hypothetical protein